MIVFTLAVALPSLGQEFEEIRRVEKPADRRFLAWFFPGRRLFNEIGHVKIIIRNRYRTITVQVGRIMERG